MRFVVYILLLIGCLDAAENRTWTDLQNRKIEAKMLGLDGETLMLELKDGNKVPLPLSKLCAADIEYARAQAAGVKSEQAGKTGANFDQPWPERIKFTEDPEIRIIEENAEKNGSFMKVRATDTPAMSASPVRWSRDSRSCSKRPISFAGPFQSAWMAAN